MERFVDIYASDIGKELDDYRSQIRSRKEKIAMMRSYHSEKHRIENARNIEDLIVASNELAEASKDLISNMATYSKNIDDQTTKMVGFTESNGKMSKSMAWMAGISIVIALASFAYSVLS